MSKRLNVPATDIVRGIVERKADAEIANMDCQCRIGLDLVGNRSQDRRIDLRGYR